MRWIYLDSNATTQPAAEVVEAMAEAHHQWWANPSSMHRLGQAVRHRVELARVSLAGLVGCPDRNLIFTSGGTESNNLVLRGMLEASVGRKVPVAGVLVTTKIEHAAIREPAEAVEKAGVRVVYLPVDAGGIVDPQQLAATLQTIGSTGQLALVSIQWANNETGVIQPMQALGEVCKQFRDGGGRVVLHTDATQVVGKIPVDVTGAAVDMLTFSSHKFHGPKGVGALYVRRGYRLAPQILGGPQERQRRGGTENTVNIIGAGVAADLARKFLADPSKREALGLMRDQFEQSICRQFPDAVVNCGQQERLWNTSNIGFTRLEAEAILVALSERGVCASAGAACSSGSLDPSPVLLAMGIDEPVAHGSIRFSLSRFTRESDLDEAVHQVLEVVSRLASINPVSY